MLGLVLWFNLEARVGMVWCEDQGPLAFLGPDVTEPLGDTGLVSGDQVFVSVETHDGLRIVSDLQIVEAGTPGADPGELLTEQTVRPAEKVSYLSVVA